ncbi:MAG: SDR family oxidoreductase [Alistipes sp.]|nr:SDR family oxidoreductase [Alistipes sp.]
MKHILVTGGAGFIGSHLCKRLLDEGNEVCCVDNFFTGKMQNIEYLRANPRFTIIHHDIVQPLEFDQPLDEIYNLACPASPVHYQYNPIKTLQTNVIGITNMLELAYRTGARLLQASTSEVYGDPELHPQPERYWGNVNPIGIRSCYDEGKRCAETLCMDYHREYGVTVKLVRIFNTYGPNMSQNDGRVISNFVVQALKGENITIYGNGSQTRSFLYISDLIEGFLRMMATEAEFTGPMNLGNPREFTMLRLAELVLESTHSSSKLVFEPLPQDDPRKRQPDITLAKSKIAWEPTLFLEEGLLRIIDYFKKELGIQ